MNAMNENNAKYLNKRSRAPNFTTAEILLLLAIIKKHSNVIENKKTDGATIKEKNETWIKILQEFNANSTSYFRTVESIQACYRSQKKKTKKSYSDAKMKIIAPNSKIDRERLVNSLEEFGTSDWGSVSKAVGASEEACQESFNSLVNESKIEDSNQKKELFKTGGGAPIKQPKEIYERVKSLIGPAVDGIFTMYDSDSTFNKEQQDLLPPNERKAPIEIECIYCEELEDETEVLENDFEAVDEVPQPHCSLQTDQWSRKTLKRRKNESLVEPAVVDESVEINRVLEAPKACRRRPQQKKNVSNSFLTLSEKKMELVEIQREIAYLDLQEKRNQSEHNAKLRKIELTIKESELELVQLKLIKAKGTDTETHYF